MIYSALESTMRNAVEKAENLNEDYSINWNFVDADAYAECAGFFKDPDDFYEAFNEIADTISEERTEEAAAETQLDMDTLFTMYPNAVDQLEVLKSDYLGL
jgi:hypothetical protein